MLLFGGCAESDDDGGAKDRLNHCTVELDQQLLWEEVDSLSVIVLILNCCVLLVRKWKGHREMGEDMMSK